MKQLEIIKIESSDSLKECAELLVDAYNSEPWNDNWTTEKALEKLMCFYASPKFNGWIAYANNEPLGCFIGNIEPYFSGDYYYLKEMCVAFKAQHNGIGRQLMATIKTEMQNMDIKTIILFTSHEFFPFEFYEKTRFYELGGMRMMHYSQE